MDSYKSDKVLIEHNIDVIYNKLSNPQGFKEQLEQNADRIPDEARQQLDKVKFEDDGISIESPMGAMKLSVTESVPPGLVKYVAQSSPVPFGLTISLQAVDENQTQAVAEINIDLPFMLKMAVGGQLKDGAQKLAQVIAQLPY